MRKCAKCEQENPADALFCMRCGARLERKCPQCGAECPEEALFCIKCGFSLSEAVSVPSDKQSSAENRPITVLFADMSGFTSMSQETATEDMVEKVNECFQMVTDAVHRYGGEVNRFIGDCALAFFGASSAHEDDPERAIMAALSMQEALFKLGLNISIGINTGMMYFGSIGAQRHLEISAYGHDINLAKRLQEEAQPGQILVGEKTYRSTYRAFAFQTIPDLQLRGINGTVTAYAVMNVLSKPEKTRGIEGLRADLIGRNREFAELKECADKLLSGSGQIVCIIGDAGVGKSRLATEFKEYVKSRKIRLLEGICVSIGGAIGYSVFIAILRSYLGILEGDTAEEIGQKIVVRMSELFPQDWEKAVPYIGNLLSVKFNNEWDKKIDNLPPERIQYETSLTLKDVFFALARQKPLALILDDLHLADNLSLDLFSLLMDELANTPLMLLCIYRPEKEHKSWHIDTQASGKCLDRYTRITLGDLSPQEGRRLIESLLQIENLPEKIKESILRRSGGNPLFLEEVIGSLIDNGAIYQDNERWVARSDSEEITVPDTLQSVIMARIDRLEEDAQYVLKCASVIGNVFRYRLLRHTASELAARSTSQREQDLDKCLWQLEERDLIYEDRAIPEREYSFKHALIQETLYRSLLSNQRRVLHRKVAEGIEQLRQDRIEEFYEELALHYSRSDRVSRAIDYLLKAGDKSKGIYANQQAIQYFEKALEFIVERATHSLKGQPEREERDTLELAAREALGDVLFTTGSHHEAETQFEQAWNLASQRDDARHIAVLTCKLADSIHWQAENDRAIEIAESGLAAFGDQINGPEVANLLEVITRSYWTKWDLESARRYAERNAQLIHQIPYFDSIYKIYYSLALVEMLSESFDAAIDWLEEMERVCLEHDNKLGLARCYHGLGDLWWRRQDYHKASQWLEKSLGYCEHTGEAHLLMEGHLELAHHLIILGGDSDQIEGHIQKGMEIAEQMAGTSSVASAPEACRMLATAYLEAENTEQAIACYRRAVEFGPTPSTLSIVLRDLEPLYVEQGQHDAFFEFCRNAKRQPIFQSEATLRYWHLEPGSISPDYPQLSRQEPFEETGGPHVLLEGWRWIVPPGGESSHDLIGKGVLELRTSSGHELYPSDPNVPRLICQITGDFAAETTLVGITEEECQIGGMLLWVSDGVYLSFGKVVSHKNEVNLTVYRRDDREIICRGWFPGHQLHLRLERRGESLSALCSSDGEEWLSCGMVSLPGDDQAWIGLYVACPVYITSSVMRFRGFRVFQREVE